MILWNFSKVQGQVCSSTASRDTGYVTVATCVLLARLIAERTLDRISSDPVPTAALSLWKIPSCTDETEGRKRDTLMRESGERRTRDKKDLRGIMV
ncbi:hypothetical protein TIFTF001_036262 [Ficus carica]|uniref:Uncharacterized protein n=1 Tax=Ficus carica TaxID=3494 RepID=A0AA88E306_FICCA|nr:hypothetical protein TIFTF001_036262 [Ficus carica]